MLRIWLMAARVRTLPAAVAPVLVGTSLAGTEGRFRPLAFVAPAGGTPPPALVLGAALGSRAVPCTQSKSDFDVSGFVRPSGVMAVLVKM